MALSTSLIKAADNLIEQFGNEAQHYSYTLSAKQTNEEGDVLITDWKTPTTIKVVDGGNQGSQQVNADFGKLNIGQDKKIIKSSVIVENNDRLKYNGKNYRISKVTSERIEGFDIIKSITCVEVENMINW